jgi:outer membrane murein-binding lipoprotein Lpp
MTAWLLAAGGFLVTLFLAYVRGRVTGGQRERKKRDAEKVRAAEDRLEMDREATDAERNAAGMADEEARREALKWARR